VFEAAAFALRASADKPRKEKSMPTRLETALQAVIARVRLRHALRAAAAGCVAAGVALLVSRIAGTSETMSTAAASAVAIVCGLTMFRALRRERTPSAAAAAFERADPSLRNLVITAQEIIDAPGTTRDYMRQRVLAEAGDRAAAIDRRKVVRLERDALAALASAVLLAGGAVLPVPRAATASQITKSADHQITKSTEFTIDLVPPAYTGRPTEHLRNPAALDALAGSQALIRVPAGVAAQIRLNGTTLAVNPEGAAQAVLSASGYLAIDAGPVHQLLPLSVTPDGAPAVRITAPAKDLRVASTAVSISIAAEANDDLALRSFELRYTIVSGTGEQFSFTEGALPAALVRSTDQAWRIDAALSLAQLKLEPGDALIYRAVAADRRPGETGVASSDTFFIEVAGPGDVALAGVEMPPDKERYALSQAMIVLKIERLQARERSLGREALVEAAGNIAAEQRAVRANFIFLLGGEIEDEEVEAEHSSEIAEGRFANKARQEIVGATVLMGRVERALTAVSTKDALPPARDAVRALQRAFGHSRYLLRALPARARIDPARRLSGDLSSAADWNRALTPPAPDPQANAARAALMELTAIARELDRSPGRADLAVRVSRLAERVLAIDVARSAALGADLSAEASAKAEALAKAARDLVAARDAVAAGQTASARAGLQRAAAPLVALAQRGRIDATTRARDAARLAGAAATMGGGRE
jgi:hypothetical protein